MTTRGAASICCTFKSRGRPSAIRIDAAALNRLKQELLDGNSLRAGGGFIFGKFEAASRGLLRVESFVTFANAGSRRLNPFRAAAEYLEDQQQLPDGEPRPVGFFRTQLPGEWGPTDEDARLMSDWFEDGNVLLLLSDARGRTSATFYRKSSEDGPGLHPSFPVFLDPPEDAPGETPSREDRRLLEEPRERRGGHVTSFEKPRRLTGVHIGLVFAVAAVLVLGILQYRTIRLIDQRPDASKVSDTLDLKTERAGADRQWRLSWNRSAPAIQKAAKGHVSIIDGYVRKEIDLSATDVQTGGIVYSPVADDVTFRLEVFDTQAGRAVSESVRVLGSPWPYAEAAGIYRTDAVPPESAYERYSRLARGSLSGREGSRDMARTASEPAESNSTPAAAAPSSGPALKPFTVPSRSLEPIIVSRTVNDLPVPPAPQAKMPSPDPVIPPAIASAAVEPPPAPKASTDPALRSDIKPPIESVAPASATTGPTGRAVTSVEPPVLLHRTAPEYPKLASQGHIVGTVRLEATVGTDGRLHDPKVLSGHMLLRQAAIDAIKYWSYRPARLNGQNIPAPTVIEIRYAPQP